MILETAFMTVHPGAEDDFFAALGQAKRSLLDSPGCRDLRINQGVEHPQTFLLLIEWDTLADHVEGFRESPAFDSWRGILGPFFAEAPRVEHWSPR